MEMGKASWKVVAAKGMSYVGVRACDDVDVDAFLSEGRAAEAVPNLYLALPEIYCLIRDEAYPLGWFGRDFPLRMG